MDTPPPRVCAPAAHLGAGPQCGPLGPDEDILEVQLHVRLDAHGAVRGRRGYGSRGTRTNGCLTRRHARRWRHRRQCVAAPPCCLWALRAGAAAGWGARAWRPCVGRHRCARPPTVAQGKTAVMQLLEQQGYAVIYVDKIAHNRWAGRATPHAAIRLHSAVCLPLASPQLRPRDGVPQTHCGSIWERSCVAGRDHQPTSGCNGRCLYFVLMTRSLRRRPVILPPLSDVDFMSL